MKGELCGYAQRGDGRGRTLHPPQLLLLLLWPA